MIEADKPRLIFWELTKECNLACRHCRAEAEKRSFQGELTLELINAAIDDIASCCSPIIVLTGGEPLYRSDVFDIAGHAAAKGLRTALATNGTLITAEIADRIRDSGIRRVSVSLDGSNSRTHDTFRGIPGSFDAALRGISHLRDAAVEFQINVTVTRRNKHELKDIYSLTKMLGGKALHLFMLVPVGCGVQLADSDMLSADRYEEVLNWLYEQSRRADMELRATCAPHYYRIVRQRAKEEGVRPHAPREGFSAMTRGCLAGSGVCFISHRGDVQPCGYLPITAGSILHQSFRAIWELSDVFARLRDSDALGGKCGLCEYRMVCGGCRARAYYEHGDILAEEPFCAYLPSRVTTR